MIFKRTIEDFTCEHCGTAVTGTGYTNHCPKCLWGKHVDVHPGDRAEACQGMMQPIRVEGSSPDYTIVHKCTKCALERRNGVADNDDTTVLLALAEAEGNPSRRSAAEAERN